MKCLHNHTHKTNVYFRIENRTWYKSLGLILPTKLATGHSAVSGRLWNTLLKALSLYPAFSIPLVPLRTAWLQSICNRRRREVICHILARDTDFFYAMIQSLVPRWDKYEGWNFNSGNYLFTTDTK